MMAHSTVILISVGLETFTFCSFNSHEEIMSNSSLKVNIRHHDFMAIKTTDCDKFVDVANILWYW